MNESIINQNEKFSTIALVDLYAKVNLPEVIEVEKDLYVSKKPLFDMSDFWKTNIGTLEIEDIESARLYILKKRLSKQPNVIDNEFNRLSDDVYNYFLGFGNGKLNSSGDGN